MNVPPFHVLLTLAVALRIILIIYGAYQDAHSSLKYTDLDYRVFSDAAKAILHPTPHAHAQGWLPAKLGWNIGELSQLLKFMWKETY